MFMHHLTDVDGVLQRIHAATRDAGLIVIAEFTDPPRFLPDDLGFGEPGLETRCIEAFKAERLRSLPSFGLEWGRRLEKAGFSAIEERGFELKEMTLTPAVLPDMDDCGLNASVRQRPHTYHPTISPH